MKIIRYQTPLGEVHWGEPLEGGRARRLEDFQPGATEDEVSKLLAPATPPAIIGIGLNYRRHAEESGAKLPEYPVVFFKNPSALQHPGDPIRLPRALPTEEVDYECEMAIVIGKPALNVPRSQAWDYVLGVTAANDVSARDWQLRRSGSQWSRAKSFDTFCPVGPVLVTPDELADRSRLAIRTVLNGETVQDWTTDDLIFDVPALIEFLSADTTLAAGTLILTGTPHGVGMARKPPVWLKPGDTVTVWLEGVGELTNPVE